MNAPPATHAQGAPLAPALHLSAPAKLNLSLAVGPPFAPGHPKAGFHPIASWFVAIDLADTLELTALPEGSAPTFRVQWAPDAPRPSPIDWPIEKDLIVRAHHAAQRQSGRAMPIAATLLKRIPVGGGCGGGSSDAAAMLLGLARLFPDALPADAWHTIGASLGSDVAFFLDEPRLHGADAPTRPAMVQGVGDSIERLTPCPLQAWLILPPFGCHTGRVYAAFDAHVAQSSCSGALDQRVREGLAAALSRGRVLDEDLFNDLAAPACDVQPGLAALIDRLATHGFRAHVTGSGSTLFVLRSDAADEETRLRHACGADVVIVMCRAV